MASGGSQRRAHTYRYDSENIISIRRVIYCTELVKERRLKGEVEVTGDIRAHVVLEAHHLELLLRIVALRALSLVH